MPVRQPRNDPDHRRRGSNAHAIAGFTGFKSPGPRAGDAGSSGNLRRLRHRTANPGLLLFGPNLTTSWIGSVRWLGEIGLCAGPRGTTIYPIIRCRVHSAVGWFPTGSLECAMNSSVMNGLPSDRCGRTSRTGCGAQTIGACSAAYSGSCNQGRHGVICRRALVPRIAPQDVSGFGESTTPLCAGGIANPLGGLPRGAESHGQRLETYTVSYTTH
jgi:hypothetical protein